MALEAQNNPYPSILMVEGDPEGLPDANPAAGQRRLAVGADHLLYLVDPSGTKTLVGGDASAHIADTTDAHDASAISIADAGTLYTGTEVEAALQEVGAATAGHLVDATAAHAASAIAFTPNGSIAATDVQAAIQEVRDEAAGGGGALSYQTALLGANVTLVTAATFYDGPAVTLSVGTWLVICELNGVLPLATSNVTSKLWDGTTVYASGQSTGTSGWAWAVSMHAIVVVASGTPTLKGSATADSNGGTIRAACVTNGQGNNASQITAVKIA